MMLYLTISLMVAIAIINKKRAEEDALFDVPVGDLELYEKRDYTIMYILFPISSLIVSAYKFVCSTINSR